METNYSCILSGKILSGVHNALVFLIDKESRVVEVASETVHLLGYESQELINKDFSTLVMREHMDSWHEAMKWAVSDPLRCVQDIQMACKDGKGLETTLSIYKRDTGYVVVGYTPCLIDYQGSLQERLHYASRLNAELAQQLEAEVTRSNMMTGEAASANFAKSVFIANMSHELRTPMTSIMGCVDLLADSVNDPQQIRLLTIVKDKSNDLLQLLNDILDLSKIEAGKIDLNPKPFSLNKLVSQVVHSQSVKAEQKKIYLKFSIEDGLPDEFIGDALRISQGLLNLVSNAVKFTHEGGVEIVVTCNRHTPRDGSVSEVVKEYELKFSVKDTGIGIAKEKQILVFEPFTQAELSTSHNYGGTGLGLSITRKLINLMDGEISLMSELGIGSDFSFNLPLDLAVNDEELEGAVKNTHCDLPNSFKCLMKKKRTGRVLLIDDDLIVLKTMQLMLERLGYTVVSMNNGQEALDKLAVDFAFDVVIVDIRMASMDGFSFAQKVRKMTSEAAQVPIVGTTALVLEGNRERCLNVGMNDYLEKPIRLDVLTKVLDAIMPVAVL